MKTPPSLSPFQNANELSDAVFHKGLQSFEAQARLARRGFQVVMATRVFGVGSLLDNHLPRR
ncbi:hypothetical protein BZK31_06200 [Pseudomonas floridensis]|uniref:Uncharacterized protein n=1 Tax=Pseudomonas floridensis TaxID=1958950 RepID=A0A1X0NA45_9PSED|nr:hypothetical protein [Pseudomonas floridensis]ORC60606.1 hypothetical protein BZK31_06200 [Pseudomonas floridensis]